MRAGPGRRPRADRGPQQRGASPRMRNSCRAVDRRAKQPGSLGRGVAIFGRKGATRHGRHRLHSAGDSGGARGLLRGQAVEDEGPMGHRVTEPGLSTLRHVHARDPPARIDRGSDVGRMDVPEMRLQGRQVWARAGCTLRRHARVPQVGAGAPVAFSRSGSSNWFPMRRCSRLPSRGTTTMNHATRASEARRRDKRQPVPSARKQVAFATNANSLGIPGVVTYCGWVAA